MRILGIDCGSARTGYGVIESDGSDHRMLVSGVICTNTKWPFERRLAEIAGVLRGLFRDYRPEFAAVEEVFHAVNAKTALKLAHVRGVVLLTIAEAGVELAEYSPLEVKINVVGRCRRCAGCGFVPCHPRSHQPQAGIVEDCDEVVVAVVARRRGSGRR